LNLGYSVVAGFSRLTSQSQPAGSGCAASSSALSYDTNGNVASSDDFNGSRSCSAYDLSRNLETTRVEGLANTQACSAVTGAGASLPTGSRKTSTSWHPDWKLETKRAEPGKLTTSIYNGQPDPFNGGALASCAPSTALLPDGKPIAVLCKQVEQATSDANGGQGFSASLQGGVANRTRSWTYSSTGQVLTEMDPLNNTTTYTYYSDTAFTGSDPNAVGHTLGDLQTITNAKSQVTNYSKYNKHGQLLESTDPNGVVTTNTYDLRQRLLSTSVGGQATTYSFDAAGQLLKVTNPDASWIGYEYDAAHRQNAVKDNLGNRIEYVLDNAGNKTGQSVKDPQGNLARSLARSIDALGRVQQTTGRE
jgi:YD repeat-containing protein